MIFGFHMTLVGDVARLLRSTFFYAHVVIDSNMSTTLAHRSTNETDDPAAFQVRHI